MTLIRKQQRAERLKRLAQERAKREVEAQAEEAKKKREKEELLLLLQQFQQEREKAEAVQDKLDEVEGEGGTEADNPLYDAERVADAAVEAVAGGDTPENIEGNGGLGGEQCSPDAEVLRKLHFKLKAETERMAAWVGGCGRGVGKTKNKAELNQGVSPRWACPPHPKHTPSDRLRAWKALLERHSLRQHQSRSRLERPGVRSDGQRGQRRGGLERRRRPLKHLLGQLCALSASRSIAPGASRCIATKRYRSWRNEEQRDTTGLL